MRKAMTIPAFLTALAAASPLLAKDDCWVPMSDWQPRGAVLQLAEQNGWKVRRIKIDDGCYEIVAQDAEGRPIEVHIDPATLDLIEIEYEDDDKERPHGPPPPGGREGHDD
jgi:hypothetical protein